MTERQIDALLDKLPVSKLKDAIGRRDLPPGRPAKLGACKYCGEEMGTVARRVHEPRCPKRKAASGR